MNKMLNLIRNENMKIYRRISTLIMIGILVLLVLAVALVTKFVAHDTKTTGDWKSDVAQQNIMYQKEMSQPATPKSASDRIKREIKINEYRMEHDIPPSSDKSLWGFVNTAKGLISLIALFVIVIGASVTANEFSQGTIKLLLIRPVNRWKILLSKYLTTLLAALLMLVLLFISSFIIGGLFFGFKGVSLPYLAMADGAVKETNYVIEMFFQYGLKCVDMLMMVTLAFMISTVFRNNALAIGLGVFLMFAGSTVVALLSSYDWVKYILFANTDLTQYFDGTPVVDSMTLSFSLIVLAVYFLAFNLISWVTFMKRDVAA